MIGLVFLLSLSVNILVGHYISAQKGGDKIFDVGFDMLPNWEHREHLADYLLVVPGLFLLFSWNTWTTTKQNKYLLILSLMYFARAVCNAVTVLPYTKREPCKIKPGLNYCNDYTFSGHTTMNVVTSSFVGAPLWPAWPLFSSLVSILTRDHYTIDIVLAWILFFAISCNI
jgi:hypothetical protein